jgi:hypothetical protein
VEHQHELHPIYDTLNDTKRHIRSILDASQYQWPDYQNIPRHSVKDRLSWSVAGQLLHTKQFKLPSKLENQQHISQASQSRPNHWYNRRNDRHRSPDRGNDHHRSRSHRTRSPSIHGREYYRSRREPRNRHRTRSPSTHGRDHYRSRSRTREPRSRHRTRSPPSRSDRSNDRVALLRRYPQQRSRSPLTTTRPSAGAGDRSVHKTAYEYAPTAYHTETAQSSPRRFCQNAVTKGIYQDHAIQDKGNQNYESGAVDDDLTELSRAEFESNIESNTESYRLRPLQTSVPFAINYVTDMMVNNHHLLVDVTQGAIQASTLLNVVFGQKPPARDASVWRSHQHALYEASYQAGKGKPYSKLSSNINV